MNNHNNGPALLVLAAGMGSRYGGLKQMDPVGPGGESIMEYSVFDAKKAGFDKVFFVIKKQMQKEFEKQVISRVSRLMDCELVFQELDLLPEPYQCPPTREKPWGTGHAILCAADSIKTPFAVVNADDFYGSAAFSSMKRQLEGQKEDASEFSLCGYRLENTLSEKGFVSRGLCEVEEGYLKRLQERTKIERTMEGIVYEADDGSREALDPASFVSMNFWGFSPLVFDLLRHGFDEFLSQHLNDPKTEFFITDPIDQGIKTQRIQVKVIPVEQKWLGVTYPGDKPIVVKGIERLIQQGYYPAELYSP